MHTNEQLYRNGVNGIHTSKGECIALTYGRHEREANADHIASLWNAAKDMTTDEAVRYLEHGAEMVELVKYLISCGHSDEGRKRADNLLNRMEGK